MTEFHSSYAMPQAGIPDDLTIPQFILDYHHPLRPVRPQGTPWLIDDATGRSVAYEELRVRTYGLANALYLKWNFGEGDVACIFARNHVDYVVAVWAVHRLGGVVSTANPAYTADELHYQLTTVKTSLLLVHPDVVDTAQVAAKKAGLSVDRVVLFECLPNSIPASHPTFQDLITEGLSKDISFVEKRLAPGEAKTKLAVLCFSSGTTGRPKAVAIPHYALIVNIIQGAVFFGLGDPSIPQNEKRYRPGDIACGVLPLFHIYGLVVNLHFVIFAGMTMVVQPRFSLQNFLKSIVRYRITVLYLVPPMFILLCKDPIVKNYDLGHVRTTNSGAAPFSIELVQQLNQVLPNASITQGYGMTETSTTVSATSPLQRHTNGGAGVLLPGVVARVVKQDGSLARVGETGELHLNTPSLALGYLNNEQATKETFVDGWLHTGDEVKFDEQGELYIVDRLKELIKVRGFQVAPAELEGHLLDHEYVADVCVVPVPNEYSGEVPLAFVVLHARLAKKIKSNPQEARRVKAELIKYVADHKTRYKWLEGGVKFVDDIPKTASGKLLRRLLRDRARVNQTQSKL